MDTLARVSALVFTATAVGGSSDSDRTPRIRARPQNKISSGARSKFRDFLNICPHVFNATNINDIYLFK